MPCLYCLKGWVGVRPVPPSPRRPPDARPHRTTRRNLFPTFLTSSSLLQRVHVCALCTHTRTCTRVFVCPTHTAHAAACGLWPPGRLHNRCLCAGVGVEGARSGWCAPSRCADSRVDRHGCSQALRRYAFLSLSLPEAAGCGAAGVERERPGGAGDRHESVRTHSSVRCEAYTDA